jgi:mannose-1-phosphate guanylyltransferase / phosphomannomutase
VRLVAGDPQSVVLRFFDERGTDITETAARKIERLFYREDFRRVFPGDIGDIGFPPRSVEYYTAALTAAIDAQAVRAHGFKVVVDYSYGTTAFVMPNVLAKLGAEVLAVNPYASTSAAASFDLKRQSEEVANLVVSSGAHLGIIIDADGEHITVIDDEGHTLTDSELLLTFVHLVASTTPEGCRVAVPVTASSMVDRVAGDLGSEVVRTKLTTSAITDAALSDDVTFAGSLDGGFVFPEFLPSYDAMASFFKLLELLVRTESRLSEVVDELPRVHMTHETVATPWEQKGTVMRSLVEQADTELELIDGVKAIFEEGWVLALPDPEEPLTHIWAESTSNAEARRLAHTYIQRIRKLIR